MFSHYCKPTSVAVSQDTRTFFVADGYCNSRNHALLVLLNVNSNNPNTTGWSGVYSATAYDILELHWSSF